MMCIIPFEHLRFSDMESWLLSKLEMKFIRNIQTLLIRWYISIRLNPTYMIKSRYCVGNRR